MKKTHKTVRYELHLDPPLCDQITMENHESLELFFRAPEHIGEWFLKLPDVEDRTMVSFVDSKYHPSVYRDLVVELLNECAGDNNKDNIPDDLLKVMEILGVNRE